ncbi:G patch domain-containing protein 2-like [Lineus longissimus]|uniref:G patch domain-containing protein 2-like n=1 Tax=Lineus longissimus TaxID=88925 RepID=UPI00315D0314
MEGTIVNDFKKLRVFTPFDFIKMDELVHDLSTALEESSKQQKTKSSESVCAAYMNSRKMQKKKRGKKRRSLQSAVLEYGMISEASESSLDEALKDYLENVVAHQSDSDEFTRTHRMTALQDSETANMMAMVESDSVTENFSPLRPHRRRRRFKRMAVDPKPSGSVEMELPEAFKSMRRQRKSKTGEMSQLCNLTNENNTNSEVDSVEKMEDDSLEETVARCPVGKRKRTMKLCGNSFDNDQENACAAMCSPSSSSLSSSESDAGIFTNDEVGREADDEQSDFFLESGPACGIPGIIPWWEQSDTNTQDEPMDPNFDRILSGSFEHMSKSSQRNFKARLSRFMDMRGREIRCGRRRLTGKTPGYTVSRYIQEQEQWKDASKKHASSCHSAEYKRLRKTPPYAEGFVGDGADPIPDSNIGNKMLQNMGWNPGNGLGPDSSGIKVPIMAYQRPKRQGLGCNGSNS